MEELSEKPVESNEPEPRTARQLIRRAKRCGQRKIGAEDKIRIVMEGLRGEQTVADLCRQEGIYKAAYYLWLKVFLEAGKKRLQGDCQREATGSEVKDLQRENDELKRMVAELTLENRRFKKSHVDGR